MKKVNRAFRFAVAACLLLSSCGKDLLAPEEMQVSKQEESFLQESRLLHWAPPTLVDPITIRLGGSNATVNGTPDRDILVIIDSKLTKMLNINGNGARNIVVKGGEIHIPIGGERRAMYLKNWKGVLHIEGVWAHAEAINNGIEGVNIDSRNLGCTFQMQNCRIDDVRGNDAERANYTAPGTFHPDVLQNWGGPTFYNIDYLTGETDYQGFMMQPLQYGSNKTLVADWRHVNINRTNSQGYTIYRVGGSSTSSLMLKDFWIAPSGSNKGYPHSDPTWNAIAYGLPAGTDYVAGNGTGGLNVAGMNYVSPGYEAPVTWSSNTSFSAGVQSLGSGNTGTVDLNFDITPNSNNIDAQVGYTGSAVSPTGYASFPVMVRVYTDGNFSARNGSDYAAVNNVAYTAGTQYHVRILANLSTKTYSAWVTPLGGTETQIALNYAFRTDAPLVTDLGKAGLHSNSNGLFTITNHTVSHW